MSIAKKLQLSIFLTGGIALLVFGAIVYRTSRHVGNAIEQNRTIEQVVRGVFELNTITNDYFLLHHEERAFAQWHMRSLLSG